MKNWVGFKTAGNILLVSMGLLLVLHLLILFRVVPYEIVWGGQVKNESSLGAYEAVALVVTLLFSALIAMRIGYIQAGRLAIVAKIGMWLVFAYFVLNTVGNLASGISAETLIFAPITVGQALLALRVAVE